VHKVSKLAAYPPPFHEVVGFGNQAGRPGLPLGERITVAGQRRICTGFAFALALGAGQLGWLGYLVMALLYTGLPAASSGGRENGMRCCRVLSVVVGCCRWLFWGQDGAAPPLGQTDGSR